jgi:vacuolar-type H+-ATPase subunit I/STV1
MSIEDRVAQILSRYDNQDLTYEQVKAFGRDCYEAALRTLPAGPRLPPDQGSQASEAGSPPPPPDPLPGELEEELEDTKKLADRIYQYLFQARRAPVPVTAKQDWVKGFQSGYAQKAAESDEKLALIQEELCSFIGAEDTIEFAKKVNIRTARMEGFKTFAIPAKLSYKEAELARAAARDTYARLHQSANGPVAELLIDLMTQAATLAIERDRFARRQDPSV